MTKKWFKKRESKDSKEIRIDESCKAVIRVLKNRRLHDPNELVPKEKVWFLASQRTEAEFNGEDADLYDEFGIQSPDEQYIESHWKEIRNLAAEKYRQYIHWERNGVRLGTIEEYRDDQNKLIDIVDGSKRNIDMRKRHCEREGIPSPSIDVKINRLPSGDQPKA